jgi:endonuclease/exonuclease/phosphatase family metal-dependent hydrolase
VTSLRVASYNLYLGADLALVFDVQDEDDLAKNVAVIYTQLVTTDYSSRVDSIAALFVREQVDVAGLQEVARWTRTTPGMTEPETWCDFLPVLLDALERAGSPYDAHAVNTNFEGGAAVSDDESMGVIGTNVILVRRASGVRVNGERTGDYARKLSITTGIDGLGFEIARGWGWVDAVVDGRPFRFVDTHIEAFDEATRDNDRDELLAVIGDPGVPVIVVGDFNSPPQAVGMPTEYADAWLAARNDPAGGFTWGQAPDLSNAESGMRQRIDYVFVRDVDVLGCRVVGDAQSDRTGSARLWPSDHACVVADLSL